MPRRRRSKRLQRMKERHPLSSDDDIEHNFKKRNLSQILSNVSSTLPNKKRKLNTTPNIVESNIFSDDDDHQQFRTMYQSIEESELITILSISHDITKQIAEYATGLLKPCANKQCQTQICVLYKDEGIYLEDHSNATELGYKRCSLEDSYFCSECMHLAVEGYELGGWCDYCPHATNGQLYFKPDCKKCAECNHPFLNCNCYGCGEVDAEYGLCNICDLEYCECGRLQRCVQCEYEVCYKCKADDEDGVWDNNYGEDENCCICRNCFDGTTIKCDKCCLKCILQFESNHNIYEFDGWSKDREMEKCEFKNCKVFVCMNCNDSQRNGTRVKCNEDLCMKQMVYCNKHIPIQAFCKWHK